MHGSTYEIQCVSVSNSKWRTPWYFFNVSDENPCANHYVLKNLLLPLHTTTSRLSTFLGCRNPDEEKESVTRKAESKYRHVNCSIYHVDTCVPVARFFGVPDSCLGAWGVPLIDLVDLIALMMSGSWNTSHWFQKKYDTFEPSCCYATFLHTSVTFALSLGVVCHSLWLILV